MEQDYFGFCLNRIDMLRTSARPVWSWTGPTQYAPKGRIREWLDLFIGSGYFPTAQELAELSPDEGTELERFDTAIHTAYAAGFAQKFGIAVEGILFTLTLSNTVSIKTELN